MPQFLKGRDVLLGVARLLVWAMTGLMIFAVVMVCVGLVGMVTVQREALLAQLSAAGFGGGGFALAFVGTALVGLLLALAIWFAIKLLRIIDSVELGDPFIPENADRLRTMGWLSAASQGILLALIAIAQWFGGVEQVQAARDAMGMLGSGIALTLVLFILARVFRLGTQMREDLEGTV